MHQNLVSVVQRLKHKILVCSRCFGNTHWTKSKFWQFRMFEIGLHQFLHQASINLQTIDAVMNCTLCSRVDANTKMFCNFWQHDWKLLCELQTWMKMLMQSATIHGESCWLMQRLVQTILKHSLNSQHCRIRFCCSGLRPLCFRSCWIVTHDKTTKYNDVVVTIQFVVRRFCHTISTRVSEAN